MDTQPVSLKQAWALFFELLPQSSAYFMETSIGEVKLLGKWDIHTFQTLSIKRIRLIRKADGYYCQFAVNVEVKAEQRIGSGEIGLDVGLEFFYSDSNGHHEPNPRFLKKAESSIKHAQRQIYRYIFGAKNKSLKAGGRGGSFPRRHSWNLATKNMDRLNTKRKYALGVLPPQILP